MDEDIKIILFNSSQLNQSSGIHLCECHDEGFKNHWLSEA